MIATMATERLDSLEQVRAFVEGGGFDFVALDGASRNHFVRRVLVKFDHGSPGRAEKGLLRRFLRPRACRGARTGRVKDHRGRVPARPFARRYTAADAVLLAEVDGTLGQLCGQATRAVIRHEFEVFGDVRFERLARISTSHLHNLCKSRAYVRHRPGGMCEVATSWPPSSLWQDVGMRVAGALWHLRQWRRAVRGCCTCPYGPLPATCRSPA